MAQLQYVVENRLHQQAVSKDVPVKIAVAVVGIIATLACAKAFTAGFAILVAGIFFSATVFARSSDSRIRSGADGEDQALRALRALPDTYTVFNQLDIPSQKSRTGYREADLVVCGPNAIFVIEVKANHGKIFCNEAVDQWKVGKVGRGGTAYEKSMRNPVAQCKSLIWCLGEHLKAVGAKPWIQGVVLFTHPDAQLVQQGELSIPVLTTRSVLAYIQSYERRSTPELVAHATTEIANLRGLSISGLAAPLARGQVSAPTSKNESKRRVTPRL